MVSGAGAGDSSAVVAERIDVEVIYATPSNQILVSLKLPPGSTIEQALEKSGVAFQFPEIKLVAGLFGIYGKLADLTTQLRSGDRVEIYRPLVANPRQMRKLRALSRFKKQQI